MLLLAEELLLIAIDDEKGTLHSSVLRPMDYGVAGALLMDLLLSDRIRIQDGQVKMADRSPTSHPILNDLLERIPNYPDGSLDALVGAIGDDKQNYQEQVIEQLVQNRIVTQEEHRTLGVFSSFRYPLRDPTAKNLAVRCLRDVVLNDKPPDRPMVYLISLVRAMDLTRMIFERSERRKAQEAMHRIAGDEPVGLAIESMFTTVDPDMILDQ